MLRVRSGEELASSYHRYFGTPIPQALRDEYFNDTVYEYYCARSGLRWYEPALLGRSNYYEWLAATYTWYYNDEPTWDRLKALELICGTKTQGFIEVGCGNGSFLKLARDKGIHGIGTEINTQAITDCRNAGLNVYHPEEILHVTSHIDTLVLLQSLEHVTDPIGHLEAIIAQVPVDRIIIAVPCFESLLGRTLDPLVWPPHHYTIWSAKALATLGKSIKYKLASVCYDTLSYSEYCDITNRERQFPESRLPHFSRFGILGWLMFQILRARGLPWLNRKHSIVVVLTRE